jgi:hypothetical protein
VINMPAQEQRRRPSLTAEFGTPGDARAAMKALENHGIDGLEITVLDGPEDDDRRPADRRELVFISGRVGTGIALGAGVGMSEDWEKTFEESAAATTPMRIGVYANGDDETMRARQVLERHRPLDIQDQTAGSGT